ncbi:uncharacterized protein METZ01_LOCUS99673, partial [marine metagenome]
VATHTKYWPPPFLPLRARALTSSTLNPVFSNLLVNTGSGSVDQMDKTPVGLSALKKDSSPSKPCIQSLPSWVIACGPLSTSSMIALGNHCGI